MVHSTKRYRLIFLVCLAAGLSGCQQFPGTSRFQFPWSKPASLAHRPAPPALPPTEPLKPEQKAEIQLAFAHGLELQGRTDEAKKIYLEVAKTSPRRADVHHRLALLHDRNGECQSAERYYQQAIRLAPNSAEMHGDLGYSYYLQQRWPEAEEHLRRAVALDPNLRRAHNNLGLLLARTGREAEAFDQFARAGCSEAEANSNLAFVLSLAERWDEARWHYRRALDIDPSLRPARDGLASLDSLAARHAAGTPHPSEMAPVYDVAPVSHHSR